MIGSKGRPPYKNPSAMSEQLKDFIEKCTIMDPAQRPTTEQMLSVSIRVCIIRIHMLIKFFSILSCKWREIAASSLRWYKRPQRA